MASVFEKLLERAGGKEGFAGHSKIGKMLKRRGVVRSGEFLSISALPRRRWEDAPDLDDLVALLSAELCPAGEETLWRVQAAAIRDAHDLGGAFLPVGVGQGKTLISLLTPGVLGAKRPLLIVPAKLREKAFRNIPELRRIWKIHPGIRILSYTEISLEKNADILDRISPDLIIADECHHLKNTRSGRTRRVHRYMTENPDIAFVAMSGTITKKSIRDYAHIARWCLKERTPLPSQWGTLCEWADAIDARVPDEKRVAPGALQEWCGDGEPVQIGYQRRLNETPGVVNSPGVGNVDASLVIDRWAYRPPRQIFAALEKLETKWITPNGDEITEAATIWRHARELAQGFWLRWDPPAPRDWMDARQEWKRYARETLRNNRREIDTELQVWNECARWAKDGPKEKQKDAVRVWAAWKAVKDSFTPNSVPVWISGEVMEAAAAWLEEERGIVWVENTAVGKALAKVSGRQYFGAGDDEILTHEDPCIASIRAHGEGKDLERFSTNLVLAPPASGDTWEQLLGRTHRSKQKADEVRYTVYLPTPDLEASFRQAQADARDYLELTTGAPQKMNYADVLI